MDNAAIIAGHSLCLPFARSSHQLIAHLRQGKQVETCGWFASDEQAIKGGFKSNRHFARLPPGAESLCERLSRLVDDAVEQACLDKRCLSGEKVRVYLAGVGPRVDAKAYKSFYDCNDIEDIKLTTSVAQLQIANMSQDGLAYQLAQKYRLKYLPPNLNCASNASLAAVHIGCQAIEKGEIDLVLVISCSEIKTQDFWFLENQQMLNGGVVQPFGAQSQSVLVAEGLCVMLLESRRHRVARQVAAGVRLRSVYNQIGANRNHDAAYLTASLHRLMKKALLHAGVALNELCAIIPHGNGAAASDKAEAQALALLLNDVPVPILAYKGQTGYTATGSGIVDLIIAYYALTRRELIPARRNDAIIKELAPYLLIGAEAVKHRQQHLLKTGVSVDGALIAVVASDERQEASNE
ncbi:beta-ketoacyl synthase N-terminal-like domain-containing protein [Pantoea sp. FN0307]|uniref:beta-ketoacyl synthase N-terminal-like domain-containing protein n=1 Tax=Pantoea sp. FN0307 TaxID=3418560 RepID=UPI003CF7D373